MFEDLIKLLEKRDHKILIPIDADEKRYLDKQCPSHECELIFKVNLEDWRSIFRDEAVLCPLCGQISGLLRASGARKK